MGHNVFDQVAPNYEAIHNRSLPPGVKSDEFVRQKAEIVTSWIVEADRGTEFRYLDFGCGNGRLFKQLLDHPALHPMQTQDRLLLHGFDTSTESLREADHIAGAGRVTLTNDLATLPETPGFDLVISCNVFHHIPPSERAATARRLRTRLRPGGRLVIWEHNPFNPATRALVRLCPFDGDACLMTLTTTRRLFEKAGLRHLRHEYVNILPPGLQRYRPVAVMEKSLRRLPSGSQYWMMFGRDI
ncbi:MAG: hypothetical protein BWK76_22855 [Desulfobulbaceae bacterium A2]|nr:MAG: hypothetical protein BWK76_22855 [Desulfobulbaceae bacterium A2]